MVNLPHLVHLAVVAPADPVEAQMLVLAALVALEEQVVPVEATVHLVQQEMVAQLVTREAMATIQTVPAALVGLAALVVVAPVSISAASAI